MTIQLCPQCGAVMRKVADLENREWLTCEQCGVQLPVRNGARIVNRARENSFENSFNDK